MIIKLKFFFILMALVACLEACTHNGQCPAYAIENIRADNQTGHSLSLKLCKGGHLPGVVAQTFEPTPQPIPPQKEYNTVFEVGRYEFARKPMQSDGGCGYVSEGPQDKAVNVPVALTSSSFKTVRLCYSDTNPDKSYIELVNLSESCPSGSHEQIEPVDDCSTL